MADTFTPEQITQILEEFFKVVGTRKYIGERYVPIFGRKGEESIQWDNSAPYEPLTIVLYQGNSYTSRQYVPIGVDITNQEFWVITGNYNAQVEAYHRETIIAREIADNAITTANNAITTANNAQNDIDTLLPKANFSAENTVKKYIDENPTRILAFDTVADMQAATMLKSGMTCHTNGFHASGDGGAAYYTVSASGTANGMDVLALQGELYATLVVAEPYVTPEQFGAWGDGTHNDTAALNRAVAVGDVICASSAEYLITLDQSNNGVVMADNRTFDLNGSTVRINPTSSDAYAIFSINNLDNVTIKNGYIVGDKDTHTGTSGEWGHGINVQGTNITISNVVVSQCWGDGAYVGEQTNGASRNVYIADSRFVDNGRNGLSIIACVNGHVNGCYFERNDRISPKSGFGIEPNNDVPVSVFIDNCVCIDNNFYVSNRFSTDFNVKIGDVYVKDDQTIGISCAAAGTITIDSITFDCTSMIAFGFEAGNDAVFDIGTITLNHASSTGVNQFLHSAGIAQMHIGSLVINADTYNIFTSNTANINIDIDYLDFNTTMDPRAMQDTDIVIKNMSKHVTTATQDYSGLPDQFTNYVVFDSAITQLTGCYFTPQTIPDDFVIRALNNASIQNRLVSASQNIVHRDGTTSSVLYIPAGSACEMRYDKTANKFFEIYNG